MGFYGNSTGWTSDGDCTNQSKDSYCNHAQPKNFDQKQSLFFLHFSSYSNPQKDAERSWNPRSKRVVRHGQSNCWPPFCGASAAARGQRGGVFLGPWPVPWKIPIGSKRIIKRFPPVQNGLIVMVNTDLICHLNDLVNSNRRLMENY